MGYFLVHAWIVALALVGVCWLKGELVATVQSTEPDCGGITMLQDTADPTRFTLVEHWPSQEIFLGPHMQQPHIQSFIQAAGGFLAGPPDISFWHPVRAMENRRA